MPHIQEIQVPALSDVKLRTSFKTFLNKPFDYRKQFLQDKLNSVFDGYSFYGQEDSLNQYATDMLHSFVLSDFSRVENFPVEFHDFLNNDWHEVKEVVKQIEEDFIQTLNEKEIEAQFENNFGYMMSCNYYPATMGMNQTAADTTRLSAHKDVSLFTTFPFGVQDGFSFQNDKTVFKLGNRNNPQIFSGYCSEVISDGNIKALNHQVELPENSKEERFSFAVFSIPKPGVTLRTNSSIITSIEYYQQYLSLF